MSYAFTVAQELLDCLNTALQARPAPPANIMLRPGEEVTPLLSTVRDECCEGLAWVRVASHTVSPSFDERASGTCAVRGRRYTLEMGVVRCAPTPGASGIPTADQWNTLAAQLDSDLDAMEAALCCVEPFVKSRGLFPPVAGEYSPRGQDGNCIGGTLTIELEADCGCPSP